MKILYIYKEYFGRRGRYAKSMQELGHKTATIELKSKKQKNQVSLSDIAKTNPDIIFLLSPFYLSHDVISQEAQQYAKEKKIPFAVISTFRTNLPYNDCRDIWHKFDYCFLHNQEMSLYLRDQGINAYYSPLGYYPDQYFPIKRHKRYDVSFIGSPQTTVNPDQDQRLQCIKTLQKYFNVKVFGAGFKKRGIKAARLTSHRQHRNVYARSRINLNLAYVNSPHRFYRNKLHIKNRFFEIPATGNFMVSTRFEEYTNILSDDMVGYYDADNLDSLLDVVEKYLIHEKRREKMAQRAHHKIISGGHTYRDRMAEIMNIVQQ